MKRTIIILIILGVVGLLFYFSQSGYKFEGPENYQQCVDAGGQSEKTPFGVYCNYKGKVFSGGNF
ncbi:MAG: hypothetical protein A3C85_04585 [Candidatus Doudnabacteria bacterium RIFCSPHIGHO2_02_FULL_48_21]|uniref:Uncharacterized protein n=1 Tax=Candidatus Doudnabacteria bacterium RIFCSPLOWO2_02_FULL_48_13 TaxID=1817845 RepID=A0A1F5QC98_9BACT|nr:MAG: hypothetical protein A3K05_00480 [Candidatus Doudnabacteria bacterium RIFCSPHIGHO2_01_48_18]OGE79690.1 MAG: hypothetical protein A2668_01170 [Candidatus Doudnabacteria bacterium RIFCSPHIGHO2_01_FULL_48_180]OGE91491.1 MAG: hypothetical protein A3F44_01370 [Candidatus Doudnabacteria bacterium RIFCSPHIGHO2_12_FULL_47_25]OGE93105.1 MAG: hypothetical protein A3C85_04585 [Candidatus Doudnabacteria bacterium RIFCSPHIGHO2_02_FULL_48_21]OGE98112.1 MAG: hypothetical protein A3A83_02545 [Candidatu